jgi:hypothetical protein
MNLVSANHSKDDVIYPPTAKEIVGAQQADWLHTILVQDDKYTT